MKMKRQLITLFLLLSTAISYSQNKEDLFKSSDVKISWLGIDFSHIKLIGDFSQFFDAGEKSTVQIRDQYFPKWNNLILAEPKKYDIKGMLRKGDVYYDIDMLMRINSKSALENMESHNTPNYTVDSIKSVIAAYDIKKKEGIGILLIAESFNKNSKEAYFHFVALNMKTKELLIHERLRGEPGGFGLRNYWAGSIYDLIKQVKSNYYKKWKREYK
jgi:hypothetical protein